MCIIIVNKKGKLPIGQLTESAINNPDSAGLMYADKGKLIIEKSMDCNEIILKYYKIRQVYAGIIVLHFRISTDGGVNLENCHPYKVNENIGLCHNGIISQFSGWKSAKSDTRLFIDNVISRFGSKTIMSDQFNTLVSMAIGSFNKIVLLNAEGTLQIINSEKGQYSKDKLNWYSNDTYKPFKSKYTNYSDKYKDVEWDYNTKTWKKRGALKQYKDITSESFTCSECGNLLITDKEFTSGICDKCYTDKLNNPVCLQCGKVLYSELEMENGICNDCYDYFYEKDIPKSLNDFIND